MANPLQVGVVGLGRRWRRHYKPALLARRRRWRVTVVCDQVHQRALREARELHCAAALGPTELLAAETVEAILLLDPQWYGLWPLELACRVGKPVLCAGSLTREDAHADTLLQQVRDSRLPVLMHLGFRFAPALVRLRDLLATQLGPPRVLCCDVILPARKGAGDQGSRGERNQG